MAATAQEIVADEARRRPPAGAATIAAGVLTLVSSLLLIAVLSDQPRVTITGALRERLTGEDPVLKIQQALFFEEKGIQLIGVALLSALTAAGTAYGLTMLFRATRSRNPSAPRLGIIATMSGAVMVAVGGVARYVALYSESSSFADQTERTAEQARDVIEAPAYIAGALLEQFGRTLLGLAFIMVALNAMRVGLLTRFMGVLGIIGGALFIIPLLGGGLPLVQVYWLIALGVLMLGRWPSGMPAAWTTGRNVPWPTKQELREQRDAFKEGRTPPKRREPARDDDDTQAGPADAGTPEAPERPSSAKRKRKRRN